MISARGSLHILRFLIRSGVFTLALLGGIDLVLSLLDISLPLVGSTLVIAACLSTALAASLFPDRRLRLALWGLTLGKWMRREDPALSSGTTSGAINRGLALTTPKNTGHFRYPCEWTSHAKHDSPWVVVVPASADETGRNFANKQDSREGGKSEFSWAWGMRGEPRETISLHRDMPLTLNNTIPGVRVKDFWALPMVLRHLPADTRILPEHMVDNDTLEDHNILAIGAGDSNIVTALAEELLDMKERDALVGLPVSPRLTDPSDTHPIHGSKAFYLPQETGRLHWRGVKYQVFNDNAYPTLGMVRVSDSPFNPRNRYILCCGLFSLGTMGAVWGLGKALDGGITATDLIQTEVPERSDEQQSKACAFFTIVTEVQDVGSQDRSRPKPQSIRLTSRDSAYRDSMAPTSIMIWNGRQSLEEMTG